MTLHNVNCQGELVAEVDIPPGADRNYKLAVKRQVAREKKLPAHYLRIGPAKIPKRVAA